jgi:predicted secreted protein
METSQLIREFNTNRLHLILAQLAPTGLLAFAAIATPEIAGYNNYLKAGFALILLASGILGALAEYSAASQAQATIDALKLVSDKNPLVERVISFRPWLDIAKFVTPAIFVAIFIAILLGLYA